MTPAVAINLLVSLLEASVRISAVVQKTQAAGLERISLEDWADIDDAFSAAVARLDAAGAPTDVA